jgi:hypothetical protein
VRKLLLALAACAALGLGACGPGDASDRAARLERTLLESCSCHPKKISGLPLESAIRASIAEGIARGLPDDEILWQTLLEHGNALLRAGVEDVAERAAAAAGVSAALLLSGLALLMLQLRR